MVGANITAFLGRWSHSLVINQTILASPPSAVAVLCVVVLRAWAKVHSARTGKKVRKVVVEAALLQRCPTAEVAVVSEAREVAKRLTAQAGVGLIAWLEPPTGQL
jgi:hypothetical protein